MCRWLKDTGNFETIIRNYWTCRRGLIRVQWARQSNPGPLSRRVFCRVFFFFYQVGIHLRYRVTFNIVDLNPMTPLVNLNFHGLMLSNCCIMVKGTTGPGLKPWPFLLSEINVSLTQVTGITNPKWVRKRQKFTYLVLTALPIIGSNTPLLILRQIAML